jgi:DNA-binding transcriptional MerR regulator
MTTNRRDKILKSPVRELQESYVQLQQLRKLVEKAEKRRTNLCGPNPSGRGQPMKTADDKFEVVTLEKNTELKADLEEKSAAYRKLPTALVEIIGADLPNISDEMTGSVRDLG